MRITIYDLRFTLFPALVLSLGPTAAFAQPTNSAPYPIDLPTALRLAGAQNLDIKIAREKVAEARANYTSALTQFFPWLAPGITYHRRDGLAQAVPAGTISDAHYQSYAPGVALDAQVALGDALYQSLAARQLATAAGHGLDAQTQDALLAAALGYYDLALAHAAVRVAQDSVTISSNYEAQIDQAVEIGIAFKGDALRVHVETERNRLVLHQAVAQQRVAAARLAQTLRLDPAVELAAQETELVPLALIATNTALDTVVARTLALRPELKQSLALAAAAREAKSGATYGPLIPSLGAQAFWGGLGGGPDGTPGTFGAQADYLVGLGWRVGPGGLFDVGRIRSSDARLRSANLFSEKLRDDFSRQAVEAFTRWQSLADQVGTAQRALAAAEEGLRLAQQRKQFEVGIVLETIQAEQDLTRARLDYVRTVAEFNQAQYTLTQLTGGLGPR